MSNTINKSTLAEEVASKTGMSKKDSADAVASVFEVISDALTNGDKVTITGFGSFEVRERAARTGVKPGTNDKIEIPASKYPAFKAGKSLKDSVKQ